MVPHNACNCTAAPHRHCTAILLYLLHHAMPQQAVESDPSFGAARNEMRDLSAEVERMVQRLETLSAAGLPTQLIHGDVHFDNVLVLDGRVSW